MIVPNLLVRDLRVSVRFYEDVLGLQTMMVLGPGNAMQQEVTDDAVFATLAWGDHQLMLQTEAHLAESGAPRAQTPTLSGSLYLRDFPWDDVLEKLPAHARIAGPTTQWYGMAELTIRDPDGYTLILGRREGAPPA